MSRKMEENINRELRGEIPGLQGDPRFGATVSPDVNLSSIVENIAISHHVENCKDCNAAADSDSSKSSSENLSSKEDSEVDEMSDGE